jgi:GcrA cell cycle regulator
VSRFRFGSSGLGYRGVNDAYVTVPKKNIYPEKRKPTNNLVPWTEARVEKLKEDYKAGLSASQIAERLGGVTRNAVIGKIHRLKLTTRTRSQSKTTRVRQTSPRSRKGKFKTKGNAAFRALFEHIEPVVQVEELVIPLHERKSIETLQSGNCRWPIGDPQHADFHFCGKHQVTGLPYCEHHARKAFQPPQVKNPNQQADTQKQLETAS